MALIHDDEIKKTDAGTQQPETEKLPEAQERQTVQPEAQEQQPQTEPNYKELFLRTNADMQNFMRRIQKERADWALLAQADMLEKLLPILDDLERAIQTTEEKAPQESATWLEGFKLIGKNLKKTLADLGVEEIDAQGDFNPELHEALMHIESANHKSGHIVQQLSKGYRFKGKVIRHARVSVAK